jgi:hypothetical protein
MEDARPERSEDRWFWPLLAVLFSVTFRTGRDALVNLFSRVSSEMD